MIGRHPNVWDYTPGQAMAFLQLAEARKKHERAHLLSIMTTAARGAPEAIKKLLSEWNA